MIIKNYRNRGVSDYTLEQLEAMKEEALKSGSETFREFATYEQIKKQISNMETIEINKPEYETINYNSIERIAFRKKLVQEYLQKYEPYRKEKKANIVIGQIASGKSTMAEILKEETSAMLVDSDIIKQGDGEFEGLREDFNNGLGVSKVHEEASELQREIFDRAIEKNYNIVLPRVTKNYNSFLLRDLLPLLKAGYNIDLTYIGIDIEQSIQRNYERYLADFFSGNTPRLVPLSVIKNIDDKPFRSFCTIMQKKNRCEPDIVDNLFAYSSTDKEKGEPFDEIDLDSMNCKYYDCIEK